MWAAALFSVPKRTHAGTFRCTIVPMSKHHGTPGGYNNHGCRNDCCRTAWAAYKKERRHAQRPVEVAA